MYALLYCYPCVSRNVFMHIFLRALGLISAWYIIYDVGFINQSIMVCELFHPTYLLMLLPIGFVLSLEAAILNWWNIDWYLHCIIWQTTIFIWMINCKSMFWLCTVPFCVVCSFHITYIYHLMPDTAIYVNW